MAALDDARQTLLAKLVAAGLNALDDPGAIAPPCVLVGPPTIERIGLLGEQTRVLVVFPIHVIAVGPGNAGALAALLGDVPAALIALAKDKPSEASPVMYVVGEKTEHPAYEFTCTKEIRL